MLSIILCTVLFAVLPISARAEEESDNEEIVYYDFEQGRFVNDIDDYLVQLNNAMITPFDSAITTYEPNITPFDISEPSEKCSNIFGHKWGDWGTWKEVSRIHTANPHCYATIERVRYCTRTHCSAYQTETDNVWVDCSH